MKINKSEFYKTFRIGIEIEGEFFAGLDNNPERLEGYNNRTGTNGITTLKHWTAGTDGSISKRCYKKDTYLYELRSPIVKNLQKEKALIDELESLQVGRKSFAYKNLTCGTHIHFSFNPEKYSDYALYAFHTADFENFFIKRYLSAFPSSIRL